MPTRAALTYLKLMGTALLGAGLLGYATTGIPAAEPLTYYIVLRNPFGGPTHCWQTQEGLPGYYGYGDLVRFRDVHGADVLVGQAHVASTAKAAGVAEDKCTGGLYGR